MYKLCGDLDGQFREQEKGQVHWASYTTLCKDSYWVVIFR
ncbi:hypothetical protein SBF1_5940004 [Candidatus Desulfosporosinus infrequens]|uniref:Uncharacterized protein n=1 Tax=Candidatus Desulfosporosinus infrequens TaxID=2043169 RepID=A0A2U3LLB5_9FIRM|nr:hypothetical protein SBF1_5940004 [Candidatus Desulfosporosinus infrequens]